MGVAASILTRLKGCDEMAFLLKPIASPDKATRLYFFAFIIFCFLTLGLIFSAALAYAASPAEQGQAVFEKNCKVCHTIGGGKNIGPDLKDVTTRRDSAWIISFITGPDKVISQGDPIAKDLVQQFAGLQMPNLGISQDDARAILAYLKDQSSGGQPVVAPVTAPNPPAQPVTTLAANADAGKDLFTGKQALMNGGPACISCHNVSSIGGIGGGTVGKDLTEPSAKLGEAGITAILKTPPFPMMKEIYAVKPLTDGEIGSIAAFLASAGSAPSGASQNTAIYFIIGAMVAVIIIELFQVLWRGRLSGVRRSLVKGGSK